MVNNNETILVLSGVNEAELLRTLCWFDKPQFGLRVMNASELAQRALVSSGILIDDRSITKSEQICVMTKAVKAAKSGYFSSDYESVRKLTASLDMLRLRIESSEQETMLDKLKDDGSSDKSEVFSDKNEALSEVYSNYISECEKSGVIDSISLIRTALSTGAKLENTELVTLKEYPSEPAEKALIDALGGAKEMTLAQLFGAKSSMAQKPEVFSAYGAYNEVLHILDEILDKENGTDFDKCTVAVTDTSLYPQLFFELGRRYGIKMTFGCGIPFANTNPAEFLSRLKTWCGEGKFNLETLRGLVFCSAFDRQKLVDTVCGGNKSDLFGIIDLAGNMRLGFDGEDNLKKIDKLATFLDGNDKDDRKVMAYIEPLKELSAELSQGVCYVLRKYCSLRKSELKAFDTAALNDAVQMMNEYSDATGESPVDIIAQLMKRNVCRKARAQGALHITSVDKAVFSLRDRLFIAGLCADSFPGTAREDPIVLDCDIALFDKSQQAPTSENLILRRTQQALDLVELANALGNKITLSYASFSASELKEENMSSCVTKLYNSLCEEKDRLSYKQLLADIKTYSFFDDDISPDRLIGRDFCAGKTLAEQVSEDNDDAKVNCFDKEKEYSPSSIDAFFGCPRKYFLSRVLGIKIAQYRKEYEVIKANEQGTIIHSCMQSLADNKDMSKQQYEQLCSRYTDKFLCMNIPAAGVSVERHKKEMIQIALNAYENDKENQKEVLFAEDGAKAVNEASGVKIAGYPDRVEHFTETDEYYIGDFKTGKTVKQDDEQPKTWLQTMCYAYILGHMDKPVKIDKCEYRYPRIKDTFTRDYKQSEIDEILTEFKECLENQYFPPVTEQGDSNPAIKGGDCSFCEFIDICGKGKKK